MMSKKRKWTAPYEFVSCEADEATKIIIEATAKRFIEIDGKYQTSLYKCLALAYECVSRLESQEEWAAFVEDPFWSNRPKRYRPKLGFSEDSISAFVALQIFAGWNYERYDRAWKYGRVIDYYHCRGIDAKLLPEKIKEDGGVEKALRAAIQFDPRRIHDMPSKELAKHKTNLAADERFYKDLGGKAVPKEIFPAKDSVVAIPIINGNTVFGEQPDGTYMLGVRIKSENFAKLMKLKVDDSAHLKIRRAANDQDWVDLKVVKFRI